MVWRKKNLAKGFKVLEAEGSIKSPIYSIGFTDVISQVNLHILIRDRAENIGNFVMVQKSFCRSASVQYHVDCVFQSLPISHALELESDIHGRKEALPKN